MAADADIVRWDPLELSRISIAVTWNIMQL